MSATTLDLTLKQTILAAINIQPGIRLAILFGSLASGKGRAESDLDLAVDAGRRFTAGEKMALISALTLRTERLPGGTFPRQAWQDGISL